MNFIIKQIVKWQLKKYATGSAENFSDWCSNSFFDGKGFYKEIKNVNEIKASHELEIIRQFIFDKRKQYKNCENAICTLEQSIRYNIDLGSTASVALYYLNKYFETFSKK